MPITKEILGRTISSEYDQRLQLGAGSYVRQIEDGSNWTKLRVLMRCSFNTSKSIGSYTGQPTWFLGLCAGTSSAPLSAAAPTHFVGYESANQFNRYSSDYITSVQFSSVYILGANPTAYVNGSKTTLSAANIDPGHIAIASAVTPSAIGITFLRNSDTSMSVSWYNKQTCTAADFASALSNPNDIPTGFFGVGYSTLTTDEVTYGAFDSACFAWGSEVDQFELSDIAAYRLS